MLLQPGLPDASPTMKQTFFYKAALENTPKVRFGKA